MGRNTGFLTYFSLAVIAWALSQILSNNIEKQTIRFFLLTSVVLALYGLLQALDLEFISWSQKSVFSTLGNVNFYSAFLGISQIVITALLLGGETYKKKFHKSILFTLLLLQFVLLVKTDSIQGIAIYCFGFLVVIGLLVLRKFSFSIFKYLVLSFLFFVPLAAVSILGLFAQGPLARILTQDSNYFRLDYMHAGLKMTIEHPWFGIGLDSFDNWYRTYRGFISAFRTGPNRTANTAHNIFLDISSGGGLILLFSYIALVILVIFRIGKILKKKREVTDLQIALIAAWLSYQFQSLLSINQIGVGIWGWILTGVIISISRREGSKVLNQGLKQSSSEKKSKVFANSNSKKNVVPPLTAIFSVLGLGIGFVLAYIPFSTDIEFRKAFNSGDVSKMFTVVQKSGSNAFHVGKTLESALKTGDLTLIDNVSSFYVAKYPREIFAWDVRSRLTNLTNQQREFAVNKIKEIDPFQYCLSPEPTILFSEDFDALTDSQKSELLGWWGLSEKFKTMSASEINQIRNSPAFLEHARSVCGR
jgi:O-antigen ligase